MDNGTERRSISTSKTPGGGGGGDNHFQTSLYCQYIRECIISVISRAYAYGDECRPILTVVSLEWWLIRSL